MDDIRFFPSAKRETNSYAMLAASKAVIGGVILWEHLDDIASRQFDTSKPLDKVDGLGAGEAADFRGSGARRIGRIDHIDVKSDECLPAPHPIENLPGGLCLSICSLPLLILNEN